MIGLTPAGSLEDAMLNEVGDPMLGGGFIARTGIEDYPQVGHLGPVGLVNQPDAVGKGMCEISGIYHDFCQIKRAKVRKIAAQGTGQKEHR
jgi:hypothetical protein